MSGYDFDALIAKTSGASPDAPAAPPPPTSAPQYDFDALVAKTTPPNPVAQLGTSLALAAGVNPDDAAKQRNLAQQLNVPIALAPTTPAESFAALQQRYNNPAQINADGPKTGSWIAQDKNNAAVVGTDVQPLINAERAASYATYNHPAPGLNATDALASSIAKDPTGLLQGVAMVGGAFPALADKFTGSNTTDSYFNSLIGQGAMDSTHVKPLLSATATLGGLWNDTARAAYTWAGKPVDAVSSTAGTWWYNHLIAPSENAESAYQTPNDQTLPTKAMQGLGNMLGLINQVVLTGPEKLAEAAPLVPAAVSEAGGLISSGLAHLGWGADMTGTALTHATRAMAFPAVVAATNTGQKVFEATGNTDAATKAAVGQLGVTIGMGAGPLSMGGGLLKRAITSIPYAVASSEAARIVSNATLPDQMQQPFDMDALIVSGLTAPLLAGVMGPRAPNTPDVRALRDTYVDANQYADAANTHQIVVGLNSAVKDNPLLVRSPGAFNDYMTHVTSDGESTIKDLYVNAKAVDQTFGQHGVTLDELQQKMPDLAAQMHEAVANDTDVHIPVADYATYLANTAAGDALIPELKREPNGKTFAEAEAGVRDMANENKQRVAQIISDSTQEAALAQDASTVRTSLADDLVSTGAYSKAASDAAALPIAGFYSTLASDMGVKPSEAYNQYKIGFTRDLGDRSGSGFAQEGISPALKTWFGASKVANEDGSPKVVYHGTAAEKDFEAFKTRPGDIGIHFGTEGQANDRLLYTSSRKGNENAGPQRLIPAYLSLKNPIRMEDAGAWDKGNMDYQLRDLFPQDKAVIVALKTPKDIREFLQARGYDGIVYKNTGETAGAHELQLKEDTARAALQKAQEARGKPPNVYDREDQQTPEYRAYEDARTATMTHRVNHAEDSYIAFKPTQIKSAIGNRGTYDARDANMLRQSQPTFYSQLSRAFEGAKQENIPGDQWSSWLKGNADKLGVKKAEIEATGLNDYLALRGKDKVTKQEIADYLSGKSVQVKTVTLGADPAARNAGRARAEADGHVWDELSPADQRRYVRAAAGYPISQDVPGETKFSSYVPPGGIPGTYRETLVTLPSKQQRGYAWEWFDPKNQISKSGFDSEEAAKNSAPEGAVVNRAQVSESNPDFKSSHFDQPNILVHIRHDEVAGADGKRYSRIVEIQSDWGQKGKKEGFKELPKGYTVERLADSAGGIERWVARDAEGRQVGRVAYPTEDMARESAVSPHAVPKAPFVTDTKSWVALGIKQALRDAVDNNLDGVVFATGEQNAALYDLSKQVDSIGYRKDGDGTYEISANKDGESVMVEHGKTPAQLEDIVGKDVAKKIVAGEGTPRAGGGNVKDLSGLDLKVGDTGMKAFYDKIVPQVANDVLKKLGGGKVEKVPTKTGINTDDTEIRWTEDADGTQHIEWGGNEREFKTEEEAKAFRDGLKNNVSDQPGIEITPKLREAIMGGMPLFQPRKGEFDPASLTTTFLKGADLSTIHHEAAHGYLEIMRRVASLPDAPERVVKDLDTALKWMNVPGDTPAERLKNWNEMSVVQQTEGHEQWAESYERWMFEGKAPSTEMQPVFARFREWLLGVYNSLQELLAKNPRAGKLNDEMRGVFDRMHASKDAIEYAEKVRGYQALFASAEEAGIPPRNFDAYQQLGKDASTEAITQFQNDNLRNMRWLSGAKDKVLKELQAKANSERDAIRERVTEEVLAEPINQARSFLTTGKAVNVDGEPVEFPKGFKLNTDALKHMYPDPATRPDLAKLRGMTSPDGLHPDDVAGIFGFNSGDGLVRELITGEPAKDKIAGLTDQRMLEEHGDLVDSRAISRAADTALHSETAARFLASGLKILTKSTVPVRDINRAAKLAAEAKIAATKVNDVRPEIHLAAEARMNKAALKAWDARHTPDKVEQAIYTREYNAQVQAGVEHDMADTYARAKAAEARKRAQDRVNALGGRKPEQVAIDSQRAALLNNRLAKAAMDAQDAVKKGIEYIARFDRPRVREALPGDFLEQIDSLRDQFDFRKYPTEQFVQRKQSIIDWAKGMRGKDFEPQIDDWLAQYGQRTHYGELTVEQFKSVVETIKSIEHTAKEMRMATINGERMTVRSIVDKQLIPAMESRGEKFSKGDILNPKTTKGNGVWSTAVHKSGVMLRAVNADLLAPDFKANRYDLHDIAGPFRRILFDRMNERAYWKADMLRQASDDAAKIGDMLGKEWQNHLYDTLDNQHLRDPDLDAGPDGMKPFMQFKRINLLELMRHLGNESNFTRLFKGYGWTPEDVTAFVRAHATKNDWLATQAYWDSFEKPWQLTLEMIDRIGGQRPKGIDARPFDVTVKNEKGEDEVLHLRGGYSPIDYDPIRSKLSAKKGIFDLDPEAAVAGDKMVYKASTTSNSSLINRVEGYTDKVSLRPYASEYRMRDTIHDLAYREALLDGTKIMDDPAFRDKFTRTYGVEEYAALKKWIQDIREMNSIDPESRGFNKAMEYGRQGVVMTGIAFRVSTVEKHGASAALKSLGYLGGSGGKYFLSRVLRMTTGNLHSDLAEAAQKFEEIRFRKYNFDRDYKVGTRAVYEKEAWREKASRWGHTWVAWSDLLSATPTAFAAYDLARIEGVPKSMGGTGKPMGEMEARAYANSIVRQAHGTSLETSRSNIMNSKNPLKRAGTLIYGFQNNTYGQMADMLDKAVVGGHWGNHPALTARALGSFIIPAVWVYYMATGGLQKGENLAEWVVKALASEGASTLPYIRDIAGFLEYGFGSSVPSSRIASDVGATIQDLRKGAQGKHSRLIQDAANVTGELAHIPGLGQLGHIAQYMYDVHVGKKHPATTAQAVKEAVVGGGHK